MKRDIYFLSYRDENTNNLVSAKKSNETISAQASLQQYAHLME